MLGSRQSLTKLRT